MKKLLCMVMMCAMSIGAFAKESSNFICTAHLYRTVFSNGHEYQFYVEVTASTCEGAMNAAKATADEVTEAL